jgi:hypothetical protein
MKSKELYCVICNCLWKKKNDDIMSTNGKSGVKKTCADCGITLALTYNDRNKPYCMDCWSKKIEKPINKEELDKLLDACINTPPFRFKDLKEQLKKEREEKKRDSK